MADEILAADVHPVHKELIVEATLGQRVADKVSSVVGSWRFIIGQSWFMGAWIAWNTFSPFKFDPPPFIGLNLMLSTQAGYTGPILQLASNRQSEIDRATLQHDYECTQAVLRELRANTEQTQATAARVEALELLMTQRLDELVEQRVQERLARRSR